MHPARENFFQTDMLKEPAISAVQKMRAQDNRQRLIVSVEAKGRDGRIALTMRSVLRVVALAGADLK